MTTDGSKALVALVGSQPAQQELEAEGTRISISLRVVPEKRHIRSKRKPMYPEPIRGGGNITADEVGAWHGSGDG